MATLTLDNLPDDVYDRLKARAARENRTVEQEAAQLLGPALDEKPRSLLELRGLGAHLWQDVDSTTWLDDERNSWN